MGNTSDDQPANAAADDLPKKAAPFALSAAPSVESEPLPEDVKKFAVAEERSASPAEPLPEFEDLGALPFTYHEESIFLVARDPRWLFCYWDFDWTKYPAALMRGGHGQFFLRISKGDDAQETIVEITPEARNWYVPVSAPDTLYTAEIGYFAQASQWVPIVTSAPAKTPPDAVANEDTATQFATVPTHLSFERMLHLVQSEMADGEGLLESVARITGEGQIEFRTGGEPTWTGEQRALLAALLGSDLLDRVSLGSEEIDQLLHKQLHAMLQHETGSGVSGGSSLFSGTGASWSAQPFSLKHERGFFLHVNAEIIFYGGTDPQARVTIDGRTIALGADGTFRYHFTFPEGDFTLPIVAQSPDGMEERSATLTFVRGTGKVGHVTDTPQPPDLDPLIGGS